MSPTPETDSNFKKHRMNMGDILVVQQNNGITWSNLTGRYIRLGYHHSSCRDLKKTGVCWILSGITM